MISFFPLFLSAGIATALVTGMTIAASSISNIYIIAFLFIATMGTVGGLQKGWHSRAANYKGAFRLIFINIFSGSLPMLLVGLWLGSDTPAGLGFILLAIVPVAGGIPAYATALGIPAERITLFALISDVIAMFLAPAFLGVQTGDIEAQGFLGVTLFFGLILPSITGILLARKIMQVPLKLRRAIIIGSLILVMFGIGSSIGGLNLNADSLGAPVLLVVIVGLARAPLGALIGALLNGSTKLRTSVSEAMLAGGYRNCALASVAAMAIGEPAAAIPGALGLASEAILMAMMAVRELLNQRRNQIRNQPNF